MDNAVNRLVIAKGCGLHQGDTRSHEERFINGVLVQVDAGSTRERIACRDGGGNLAATVHNPGNCRAGKNQKQSDNLDGDFRRNRVSVLSNTKRRLKPGREDITN